MNSIYEGAVKEDGRGPTVWDTFSHTSGKIIDNTNADVAVDQYHLYREDIDRMKDMGMDAYRFSVAWSRIFPNGTGEINQAGVDHYNNLINALLAKGYDVGLQAPGRCSILNRLFCRAGNSATEPYIVAHNVLLAHGNAADIYRKKYQARVSVLVHSCAARTRFIMLINIVGQLRSLGDIVATQRAQDFQLGWFLDPVMFGDYPSSMRSRVGGRLPRFSKSEAALVKGSVDFVGINHYTTFYASNDTLNIIGGLLNDSLADSGAITLPFAIGKPTPDKLMNVLPLLFNVPACRLCKINYVTLQANSIWLYIVPHGMRSLMNYIKLKYENPPVIITENGMDDPNNLLIPIKDALKDQKRIKYHNDYLTNLLAAIKEDGCNVKGYFVWSLLDNWEWAAGYTSRFGLYFVDYNDKLKRYPKDSVQWFKKFLASS
ncbi:hypothetical protein Patl1_16706 [Pistacia atlantica]|uniref:Uncharacterized protein n=1 Tax=Pistacia atlantica TaxID=434234 RepID=A0ACC1B6G2_9ROSI|nr:hypothetical protein Patl1_16706 [Pistacia atlantica]